jgi:hypothetical protein
VQEAERRERRLSKLLRLDQRPFVAGARGRHFGGPVARGVHATTDFVEPWLAARSDRETEHARKHTWVSGGTPFVAASSRAPRVFEDLERKRMAFAAAAAGGLVAGVATVRAGTAVGRGAAPLIAPEGEEEEEEFGGEAASGARAGSVSGGGSGGAGAAETSPRAATSASGVLRVPPLALGGLASGALPAGSAASLVSARRAAAAAAAAAGGGGGAPTSGREPMTAASSAVLPPTSAPPSQRYIISGASSGGGSGAGGAAAVAAAAAAGGSGAVGALSREAHAAVSRGSVLTGFTTKPGTASSAATFPDDVSGDGAPVRVSAARPPAAPSGARPSAPGGPRLRPLMKPLPAALQPATAPALALSRGVPK